MEKRKYKGGLGALVAIGLLIFSKLKWLLAVLKFSKFGGMLLSLVFSLGTYVLFFGWRFGVALIYLLFIHEMGHLVAARQKGIKTSPAIFIPFVGAAIAMKEQPKNAADEAYLAYGGPFAGLISIVPALILYAITGQPLWALVIMLGAMLNLFNLFPISPLDGGRIVGVLSPHIWALGLIGLLVFTYFFPSVLLVLIIILGLFSWWRRVRENFMIKGIKLQAEIKQQTVEKMATFKKDLFYEYVVEDEGAAVNNVMKAFVIRELRELRYKLQEKLVGMKKWTIPFFQDKAKLEKQRLIMLSREYEELMGIVDRIQYKSDVDRVIMEEKHIIQEFVEQEQKINRYYDTSLRTKILVFVAYILLAGVLGLLYIYGQNILDSFYWGNPSF